MAISKSFQLVSIIKVSKSGRLILKINYIIISLNKFKANQKLFKYQKSKINEKNSNHQPITGDPTTTTPTPCDDIWEAKKCEKMKKKGKCGKPKIDKKCRKTCGIC